MILIFIARPCTWSGPAFLLANLLHGDSPGREQGLLPL